MLGNSVLFITLFGSLLYLWYLISSTMSGSVFNLYSDVSFFAVACKKSEYDFIRSGVLIFFGILKVLLLIVIVVNLDFFSFSENPAFFTGHSGSLITYDILFYGIFIWQILSSLELFLEGETIEMVLERLRRPVFILLFLFSFSSYYQTPYSDYVILRQQTKILYGFVNLGCVSHIFFFALFFLYTALDLRRLNTNIIQSKIGLLNNLIRFAEIFMVEMFIVYAFLGWTSQLPFVDIFSDRFPNSGPIFEVLSLFIKLSFVHLGGLFFGYLLGGAYSLYISGIEKYLQLLSTLNVFFLIGINLWQ